MKKIWRNITTAIALRNIDSISLNALTPAAFSEEISDKATNRINTLNVLFVILIAFLGDRAMSQLLAKLNMKSQFRYSRVYNGTGASDLLLIGNSRGHAFYQPAIRELTSLRTLNLSYNALPIPIARALGEDYLDLYPAPKKIVIEISMLNKNEDNVINSFKLYRDQSERISNVIEQNSRKTSVACDVANLYAYNTEVFHRSLYYINKEDSDWILHKEMNAGLIASASSIEPMTFEITEDRLDHLKALVEKAKSKGSDVKLVVNPYYPAYLERIGNLNEFISKVENATGLEVYNYSGLIKGDQYFSDYLHLNKKGSIVLNKKLKEDGVL